MFLLPNDLAFCTWIMHFALCGNAADFSCVTRWAHVSIQRRAFPKSIWMAECFILPKPEGKTVWTGLVLALQNSGIRFSVPAGMSLSFWLTLSWYCLHPVPCRPFPREPGASYLQRLWFKQACEHTLGSHWRQWDFSMLLKLNICFRGLLKCGSNADAVCQMCSRKTWKSPWCCHIYKLISTGSLLDTCKVSFCVQREDAAGRSDVKYPTAV